MQLTASRQRVLRIMLAAGGLLASATALAIGIGAVLDRPATLMSPTDYRAAKASIREQSRFALDKCLLLEGAIFDVCQAQALGEERTHRAMLEARYLGTVDAAEGARQAQAEATFDVAIARCDGHEGKARLACLKDARSDKAKQLSQPGVTS